MKKTNTIHFGIQRKIVSNMTAESWETIPHVTYNYEPDVTAFMREYKRLNFGRDRNDKITINTLMLKVITEGLKDAPILNSHLNFNRKLVRGELNTYEDINISMPMILPNGEMMTVNLHNFENKNLDEMTAEIKDVTRRAENTDLNEVMFDVSLDNTITALKKGKIKDLKDKIEWVSRTDDSLGYDIRSYDVDKGTDIFIEVKTTTGSGAIPFYMSENELNKVRKDEMNYYQSTINESKLQTYLKGEKILNINVVENCIFKMIAMGTKTIKIILNDGKITEQFFNDHYDDFIRVKPIKADFEKGTRDFVYYEIIRPEDVYGNIENN